jgi:hypothetical protein
MNDLTDRNPTERGALSIIEWLAGEIRRFDGTHAYP